jgi:nitroreductase
MTGAFDAALRRRSQSKVTEEAPSSEELARLVAAAGRVADHSKLRPWRLIEIRGDARDQVGLGLAKAQGVSKADAGHQIHKARRAPLLIAVVAVIRTSDKVPAWEQEAVASGVAHMLSLLLDEAGWGVFWRTGGHTRAKAVAKRHDLAKNERLMGWLYVGGRPDREHLARRASFDPAHVITRL